MADRLSVGPDPVAPHEEIGHSIDVIGERSRGGVGSLENDVGPEMHQQLLAAFLGHLPPQLAKLHNAAVGEDFLAARYVAHQIKGTAPSFGATHLEELADRLLHIGRDRGELLRSLTTAGRQRDAVAAVSLPRAPGVPPAGRQRDARAAVFLPATPLDTSSRFRSPAMKPNVERSSAQRRRDCGRRSLRQSPVPAGHRAGPGRH